MGAGIVGRAVTLAGQQAGVVRGVVAPLTQSVAEALDPRQATALGKLFRQLDAGITNRATLVFDGKGASAAKHAALSLGDGGLVNQARAGFGLLTRTPGESNVVARNFLSGLDDGSVRLIDNAVVTTSPRSGFRMSRIASAFDD